VTFLLKRIEYIIIIMNDKNKRQAAIGAFCE
jgi:hypothetical protein